MTHDGSTYTEAGTGSEAERIGPYRLLQKLGEGGMGEVYLADQLEPVRRRVALKIIKRGLDTKQVVARFEAERQALALMNHANVAKVFDAGATPQGRPYFAMECVQGLPITEHCDRHRLTTRERMELFLQVCEGVQHAHQKGIIHRDIKPSNVLVQVDGDKLIPKIIDFGVAKATQQRLTERTVVTELGQMIGTPEYMSPEQAEMTAEDIDTRTDVYSLGVLLYELLVGFLPFDSRELRQAGMDEIRRRIREDQPSKPSTRLSTADEKAATGSARNRHTDQRALVRQLRGDVDWITLKALEKDRTRRYGSPSELAADIRRHLRHEPVLAGPPNVVYRTGKFVRRHRVGVGVAVLLLGVMVVFTVTTTVQSRRIAQEARTSERVSEFLADMLGSVEPEVLGRLLVTNLRDRIEAAHRKRGATDEAVEGALASFSEVMRGVNATDAGLQLLDQQILARAGRTIEKELAGEPRIAGRLEHTIGETYLELGLYEQAGRHLRRAVEIQERVFPAEYPGTLRSRNALGRVLALQSRFDEAAPLFLATLAAEKRVLGNDHPDTLRSMNGLANLYNSQGRYDLAEPLFLGALAARRRVLGGDHPDTLASMNNLANLYVNQGRFDEAEPLYVRTLESRKRVLGVDRPYTLYSMNNLANLYVNQRRFDEAEKLCLDALETSKRVLGDDHPYTLHSRGNLANMYDVQGRYGEAEPLYLETLQAFRRVLGDDHAYTLYYMNNLAILYEKQGRDDRARPLAIEYMASKKRRAEMSTDPAASNDYASAALTCELTDLRDPRSALKFALAANERTSNGNPDYLDTLALAYHLTGDRAKAIETERRALSVLPAARRDRAEFEKRLTGFEAAPHEGG